MGDHYLFNIVRIQDFKISRIHCLPWLCPNHESENSCWKYCPWNRTK